MDQRREGMMSKPLAKATAVAAAFVLTGCGGQSLDLTVERAIFLGKLDAGSCLVESSGMTLTDAKGKIVAAESRLEGQRVVKEFLDQDMTYCIYEGSHTIGRSDFFTFKVAHIERTLTREELEANGWKFSQTIMNR